MSGYIPVTTDIHVYPFAFICNLVKINVSLQDTIIKGFNLRAEEKPVYLTYTVVLIRSASASCF